jgi:uncharacterized protein (TIGR00730 family)
MTDRKRTFQKIHPVCAVTIDVEMTHANDELRKGLETMEHFEKSVTMYGSARLKEGTEFYEKARAIAAGCARLGYAVVSGGGPGIMEAANRGAFEEKGESIGFNIELPFEQKPNAYQTTSLQFEYFFTRKEVMQFSSDVFIVFPGGFGTFDEVFQVLTHVQTGRMPKVPIILVGEAFWRPFDTAIRAIILKTYNSILSVTTKISFTK